jgi:hypothetical protein
MASRSPKQLPDKGLRRLITTVMSVFMGGLLAPFPVIAIQSQLTGASPATAIENVYPAQLWYIIIILAVALVYIVRGDQDAAPGADQSIIGAVAAMKHLQDTGQLASSQSEFVSLSPLPPPLVDRAATFGADGLDRTMGIEQPDPVRYAMAPSSTSSSALANNVTFITPTFPMADVAAKEPIEPEIDPVELDAEIPSSATVDMSDDDEQYELELP